SGPISVNTMPSGPIAVPRARAVRVPPVPPGRNIAAATASAEAEQARAPGAGVAGAAVAAAVAVAEAEAAVAAAAAAHALDQFVAAGVQPLGAADRGGLHAALARLALAVLTELVVGLELVAQLAHAQFHHDRVVEEAQHLDVVRDHVLRVGEVHQRGQDVPAILFVQVPAFVADHRDHVVQALQALADEVGQAHLLGV